MRQGTCMIWYSKLGPSKVNTLNSQMGDMTRVLSPQSILNVRAHVPLFLGSRSSYSSSSTLIIPQIAGSILSFTIG